MTYNVEIFGIDLVIKPIAFTLKLGSFTWDIYWYGIIIALGFMLAVIYGMKNAHRFNLDTDRMLDVILVTTPVSIICARAYYLIFDGEKMTGGIKEFFGFAGSGFSGLAIYGAVIAAFVCGGLMCYLRKVNIFDMFDVAALAFLIGQGIGRWGNFFNQEAFGTLTNDPWWGMQSENTIREVGVGLVHPCFLYESIWCLSGFVVLHILSKKRKFSGQMILMYGVWYGFGRAIIEGFRTDSLYLIGNIRVSQALSILLCVASAAVLIYMFVRIKKKKTDGEYVEIYNSEEQIPEIKESENQENE